MTAGTPLAHEYKEENVDLVKGGMSNLGKHISNTAQYGVPVIVAINKFATDTAAELDAIREASLAAGGGSLGLLKRRCECSTELNSVRESLVWEASCGCTLGEWGKV